MRNSLRQSIEAKATHLASDSSMNETDASCSDKKLISSTLSESLSNVSAGDFVVVHIPCVLLRLHHLITITRSLERSKKFCTVKTSDNCRYTEEVHIFQWCLEYALLMAKGLLSTTNPNSHKHTFTNAPTTPRLVSRRYSNGRALLCVCRKPYK